MFIHSILPKLNYFTHSNCYCPYKYTFSLYYTVFIITEYMFTNLLLHTIQAKPTYLNQNIHHYFRHTTTHIIYINDSPTYYYIILYIFYTTLCYYFLIYNYIQNLLYYKCLQLTNKKLKTSRQGEFMLSCYWHEVINVPIYCHLLLIISDHSYL